MKSAFAEFRIGEFACVWARLSRRPGYSLAILGATLLVAITGLSGCRHQGPPVEREGPDSLELVSNSLADGRFPASLTCDGVNTSPALAWNAPPDGTGSFALILNDRDLSEGFVHWLLFNLPPGSRSLPASLSTQAELPDGTLQGKNDFDKIGYGGPCPGHSDHHYVFMLFALDTKLNLPAGATRAQLDDAMKGHVLARGELVARYHRSLSR
jgi:Raf kinase inhibitor-like YbhB/YbcL family protein